MDPSLYKSVTTTRGLRYSYYTSPAEQGKPTLLFCHGFPSTSRDWRYFAPYFSNKGYGVIVPDLLGFGDTDKPTDPSLYVSSRMSQDFVDILNAEGVEKAIAIGHDWGSKAVSRLAVYHPERFMAYGFLAVPYTAPRTGGFSVLVEAMKKLVGYETFGYYWFFSEDDADTIIREHIDSFASIVFPHDPNMWMARLFPVGALRASLLEDFTGPLPPYITQEDVEIWKQTFLRNGFVAPTCWYKIMTNDMQSEDDGHIPPERAFPPETAPIFFGAAKQDVGCLAQSGHTIFKGEDFKNHRVTIRDFDADHWIVFSRADEVCQELDSWIQEDVLGKVSV